MSVVILPLISKLLHIPPLMLIFFSDLLTFLVYALTWKPYLAAALLVPMYGGTLLNVYSRYRLSRVVLLESFFQVPWACWLLGGGIKGVAFATCFVAFRLYLALHLKHGTQHVEVCSRKARKRNKLLKPVPVHQLDYTIWNCKVAFFFAAHIWLIEGAAAIMQFASWSVSQWLKMCISLVALCNVWQPVLGSEAEAISSRMGLAWGQIDRAAKGHLESF